MNTAVNLPALDIRLPISSLDAYISHVHQLPMLAAEEELDLATRLQQHNDLIAARRMVLAHLRYVVRVARGYMGYGLPLGDLIQEGNVGLMKAVRRFDPTMNVRLVTFAMHWIKAEIHEYVLRNWRIVKVATTKAQRKLFFNLRQMKKHLGWLTNEEVNDVARDLKVKPETVRQMEARLSSQDAPFEFFTGSDSEEDNQHFSPAGYLEDHRYNPAAELENNDWRDQSNSALHIALTKLDDRSRDILEARWLADDKATLQDLAARYSVSAERIRQLEKNAMQKLKSALVKAGAA